MSPAIAPENEGDGWRFPLRRFNAHERIMSLGKTFSTSILSKEPAEIDVYPTPYRHGTTFSTMNPM
jgi:hypothetical protein